MLIYFKFKNFMSFGEECAFDMTANTDKQHRENLIDNKYSKIALIYGANASGKTSFIQAIAFVRWLVGHSNNMLDNTPIPVIPFRFRPNEDKIPSEFEMMFIFQGKRYCYAFSCTQEKIIRERLDVYNSSKATNIFERTDTDNYTFKHDMKFLCDVKEKNTKNKLFLVTSATWNYALTKPVVDFIITRLFPYAFNEPWSVYLEKIQNNGEFEQYKKFSLNLFENSDFSISDFVIREKKFKDVPRDFIVNSIVSAMTQEHPETIEQIANSNVYNILVTHKVYDKENISESQSYTLDLREESLGTIQMFELSPVLYYVFKNGITFFVDEIDKSLHPMLARYIIKLFLNPEVNTNNAQLIANTHDTNLLDLNILRRDEIWFTERDYKNGKTTLYPLSDFSPRKDENIEKAYLLGRFGAIPFIKEAD